MIVGSSESTKPCEMKSTSKIDTGNLMVVRSNWDTDYDGQIKMEHSMNNITGMRFQTQHQNGTVLNDLSPPTNLSQLQYSPTMSLKGSGNTRKVNIMSSPVQIKLPEPSKINENRSHKNNKSKKSTKGEIVFVNYSVQDTTDPQKKKKQSKKDKMLKLFTGNSNSDEGKRLALMHSSPNSAPASLPNSATKRSYASLLKCHRFTQEPSKSPVEMVPKSTPIPNGQKPSTIKSVHSNVSLVQNNGRCSLSHAKLKSKTELSKQNDLLTYNVPNLNLNDYGQMNNTEKLTMWQNLSNTSKDTKAVPNMKHTKSFAIDCKTWNENDNEGSDFDHHYLENYQDHGASSAPSLERCDTYDSLMDYPTDENDASIAFNRLFTRKRTNTGGSMSSLASASGVQPSITSLHRNLSTSSVSASFRSSFKGSNSQSRTRSSTRTSSHRLSRDLASSQFSLKPSPSESYDVPGMESYLDTQHRMKPSHKKKQESISDVGRIHMFGSSSTFSSLPGGTSSTSMSSSSSTPGTFDYGLSQAPSRSVISNNKENILESVTVETEYRPVSSSVIPEDSRFTSSFDINASNNTMATMAATNIHSNNTVPDLHNMAKTDLEFTSKDTVPINREVMKHRKLGRQNIASQKQLNSDVNNELFSNYLDFNFMDSDTSQLFTDSGNVLHQVIEDSNNDLSTLTSCINDSPITLTVGNVSPDNVATTDSTGRHTQNHLTSIQSSILNDIERLGAGLNVSDFSNDYK